MANRDHDIAALYRVRLAEFTAARNALAKRLGADAGDVRTLEKPHAAAWAVNQLFWERRSTYDGLIRAGQAMRQAHALMLSGRKTDVPKAEGAHRDAIRSAAQAIRELAQAAGETLSGATMEAVAETLQALPSADPPGRLTRPLKPLGLGALAELGVQGPGSRVQGPGSRVQSSGARVQGPGSRVPGPSDAALRAAEKKAAGERAKRVKALQKVLREAEAAEREAESALGEARRAVVKVERDYAAVRDRLQFLEKQRSDVEQEAHRRARAAQDAANKRLQATQDLQRET